MIILIIQHKPNPINLQKHLFFKQLKKKDMFELYTLCFPFIISMKGNSQNVKLFF